MKRDGSGLNRWAPHLLVVESGGQQEASDARASWGGLLLLLIPIGVVLLVRAANGRRIERQNTWKKAWPLTQPGPQLPKEGELVRTSPHYIWPGVSFPRRRSSPRFRPSFARPAWFGLVMVLCYIVVDIPIWVIVLGTGIIPAGLPVRLMNPAVSYQLGPGIQPLLVRLVDGCHSLPRRYVGPRPCLYIDSQLVSWDSFDSVLREKLRLRPPNWPVYLEGDKAMEWEYAVEAIDKIRGLHAEVVLLGSRKP